MQRILYGCECTFDQAKSTQHWFDTAEMREESIRLAGLFLRTAGANSEVKLRRLMRLDDGPVYVEDGAPALHVKWRRTKFRASHCTRYCYTEHLALVDVINGHVIIIDSERPFTSTFYDEWTKEQCLDEYTSNAEGTMGRAFWPAVRPAQPGEQCHYVVVHPSDCATLRTHSRPALQPEQLNRPYQLPAFA